jgi:hypothetical protein
VLVPLFPVALLFFAPGSWRARWRGKVVAVAVMVGCFLLAAGPILYFREHIGACTGDHVYLGLLDHCTGRLGVGGAPYRFGGPYSDNLMVALTQDHAQRVLAWERAPAWYTLDYDEAGMDLIWSLVQTFPADFATRACASVWRILEGFHPAAPAPRGLSHPVVESFFQCHQNLLMLLGRYGPYQAVLVVALVAARARKRGFFLGGLALFLLGLGAVQFNLRHHFHWNIAGLWMAGFLLAQGLALFKARRSFPGARLGRGFLHAAMVLAVLGGLVLGGLSILRLYQRGPVERLLRQYADASWSIAPTTDRGLADEKVRVVLELPSFAGGKAKVQPSLWAVDVVGPAPSFSFLLRYTPAIAGVDYPGTDFSWALQTPALESDETARLYFPVYETAQSKFEGIEVSQRTRPYLRGVFTLPPHAALPDTLLFVCLRPGWEDGPLAARMLR